MPLLLCSLAPQEHLLEASLSKIGDIQSPSVDIVPADIATFRYVKVIQFPATMWSRLQWEKARRVYECRPAADSSDDGEILPQCLVTPDLQASFWSSSK